MTDKGFKKFFTAIQWNAQCIRPKTDELKNMASTEQCDLILLSETWLNEKHDFSLRGYQTYRSDRDDGRGGVAILVKNTLKCTKISIPATRIEAVGVNIYFNGTVLSAISFYDPKGDSPMQDYDILLNACQPTFLMAGDANAHHQSWGSRLNKRQGHDLFEWLTDTDNVNILNDGSPTYISNTNGATSVLDLTFASTDLATSFVWAPLDYGTSDHLPVKTTIQELRTDENITRQYWSYKRADWPLFRRTLVNEIANYNPGPLSQITDKSAAFGDMVHRSAIVSIPLVSSNQNRRPKQAWWNHSCLVAVKKHKKARRKAMRTGALSDLISMKQAAAIARRTIKMEKGNYWVRFSETVNNNTPLTKVWRLAKSLHANPRTVIPPLMDHSHSLAITAQARGSLLLKTLLPDDRPNAHQSHFLVQQQLSRIIPVSYNKPFLLSELETATSKLKPSAPGPDSVSNTMLKELPSEAQIFLLQLLNECWESGTVPTPWKHSNLIPILKPKKDPSDPNNYRPISLNNCLLKLYERMIQRRLYWLLESHNRFYEQQYGFRKGRSTTDALIGLVEDANRAIANKKYCLAVFLDISKAFDKTWHHSILAKLRLMGIQGNLYNTISSYLEGRSFTVCIDGIKVTKTTTCGVPQGGVLSPLLFELVINDIAPANPIQVHTTLFADDVAARTTSKHLNEALSNMQTALDRINTYCKTWGLQLNAAKSVAMLFSRYNEDLNSLPLHLDGNRIPFTTTHKVLGHHLHHRMNWKTHALHLAKSASSRLNVISLLRRKFTGATQCSLRKVYVALVRSRLEYGSFFFLNAPKHVHHVVNLVQNRALRLILGLPRSTAIAGMEVESHLPPLPVRREYLFLSHYLKLQSRNNRLFLKIQKAQLYNSKDHLLPLRRAFSTRLDTFPGLQNIANTDFHPVIPSLPPWDTSVVPNLSTDYDWLPAPKGEFLDHELRQAFLERLHSKPSCDLTIYTDGSKTEDQKAASIGLYCHDTQQSTYRRIPGHLSILTVELYAILHALQLSLLSNCRNIRIISDSQTALKNISSSHPTSNYVQAIHDISTNFSSVSLLWSPSHVGIYGNEQADRLAKLGLSETLTISIPTPLQDMRQSLRHLVNDHWTRYWENCHTGRLLFSIKPKPCNWSNISSDVRDQEVAMSALRCRRANLPETLFLHDILENDLCRTCNRTGDVAHYLTGCTLYTTERTQIITLCDELGFPFTPKTLLGGAPTSNTTRTRINKAVISYITETVGIRNIIA